MTRRNFIYISTVTLLFHGCAYRECSGEDSHEGIFNALTCNYDEKITKLKEVLSEEKAKELKLFNAYQRLIAEVNNKRGELEAFDNSVRTIEEELVALKFLLRDEPEEGVKEYREPHRKKIRKHLVQVKQSLDVKKIKFKKADIKLTRAYLNNKTKIKLSKKYENSNDIKLAKAFVSDSKSKKIELARAYDKGYSLDTEIRTSLKGKIDTMIEDIDRGDTIDNQKMMANIKLTRKYTDSVS